MRAALAVEFELLPNEGPNTFIQHSPEKRSACSRPLSSGFAGSLRL
jgi:hypothetical protein